MIPKIIFSDFDGTLTKGTEFIPKFFDILSLCDAHSIPLVIVTGRSLSWAHFLITHFTSLNYVIAEGGGVLVKRDNFGNPVNELFIDQKNVKNLEIATKSLLKKFPDISLSADSFGRLTDRAIELNDLLQNLELLKSVKKFLDKGNINFSTSNVHLNFWSGDVSKYDAVKTYLEKYIKDISMEECIYFGDSLNDESMFRYFKHSVGVSSIKTVLSKLEYKPQTILIGDENDGPDGVYNHLTSLLK